MSSTLDRFSTRSASVQQVNLANLRASTAISSSAQRGNIPRPASAAGMRSSLSSQKTSLVNSANQRATSGRRIRGLLDMETNRNIPTPTPARNVDQRLLDINPAGASIFFVTRACKKNWNFPPRKSKFKFYPLQSRSESKAFWLVVLSLLLFSQGPKYFVFYLFGRSFLFFTWTLWNNISFVRQKKRSLTLLEIAPRRICTWKAKTYFAFLLLNILFPCVIHGYPKSTKFVKIFDKFGVLTLALTC